MRKLHLFLFFFLQAEQGKRFDMILLKPADRVMDLLFLEDYLSRVNQDDGKRWTNFLETLDGLFTDRTEHPDYGRFDPDAPVEPDVSITMPQFSVKSDVQVKDILLEV